MPNVYIENKFSSEVIEMNISNAINTVSVSGSSSSSAKKTSEKNKWKLTDSLKEKIVELAKKDAKNNIYMGNEFMNLRKAEVAKVAPNRAALIGKFNQSMSSGNMGDMKKIQEADKRWLCILFGIPYEAEFQGPEAMIPPFLTASLSSARAAVVPCVPHFSSPISSRI